MASGLWVGDCVKPERTRTSLSLSASWLIGLGCVVSVEDEDKYTIFSLDEVSTQLQLPKQKPDEVGITVNAPKMSFRSEKPTSFALANEDSISWRE